MNSEKRPAFKISFGLKDKILLLFSTLCIISMWLYLVKIWSSVPKIIPTHFGFSGSPDSFGSKNSLFILPIISLTMHILFLVLSKVPQFYNYPVAVTKKNSERLYKIGRQLIILLDMEISLLFSVLFWQNIQAALGNSYGINAFIMFLIIGIIFLTVIYEIMRMMKIRD